MTVLANIFDHTVPGPHCSQAPVSELTYVPGWHAVHDEAPSKGDDWPAGQSMHFDPV